MTFDPGNPYRRKSSLVSSEASAPSVQRPSKRDECVVHQFLQSQRHANGSAADAGTHGYRAHHSYANPKNCHDGAALPEERDMDALVEPKSHKPQGGGQGHGHGKSRAVLEPDSFENDEVGQADQQVWTREMTKSMSELDITTQHHDDVHSRMLTKRQLSDMAWGVRELSRRLSSMRIRIRVKTIFLLTKIYDQDLIPKTRDLCQWLLAQDRDVKYTVWVQDKLKDNKKFDTEGLIKEVAKGYAEAEGVDEDAACEGLRRRLRFWDEGMCRSKPHTFDFVISLGGDGTVLYASWLFQRIVPPVLSFALGSLGFLTKFDFDEFVPILESAFSQGVTVSLRLRFEGTVMRSQKRKKELAQEADESEEDVHRQRDLVEELIGEEKEDAHTHRPDGMYEILNEIVVDRGPNPSE